MGNFQGMELASAFKIPLDAPTGRAKQYLCPTLSSTLDPDNPFTVSLSFSQVAILGTETRSATLGLCFAGSR